MIAASALLLLLAESGCEESISPAVLALEQGDPAKAKIILDSAKELCAHSARFFELVGVSSDLVGDSPAAEDAFRRAVSLNPRSARLLANLGAVCLRNNKVTEAANALEQSIAIDSSDSRVLFTLGTLFGEQGAYGKAAEYLRRIPDQDADYAAYFNLGLAYSHLAQFEKARGAYYHAIDKQPGNIEAYLRIGVDYAMAGEPRKSIPWLFRASELGANRPDIAYSLAEQLLQLKYLNTAEEVINSALEKSPDETLLTLASGDIDQQKKNYPSAISKYEKLIGRQPRLPAAYVGIAQVTISEGREEDARGYLLKALSIDPDNAPANSQLGILESHQGNWNLAVSYLNKAWSKDRSNSLVGLELARVLRHSARLPDALRLMESLQPRMRDSAPFHAELALLYGQLHRTADVQVERARVTTLETETHAGLHFEDPQIYVR